MTLGLFAAFGANAQDTVSLPDGAQPGECYARVLTAATFETKTEQVMSKEASETISVVPATFATVTERILVKEAGEKIIIVGEDGMPLKGSVKPTIRTLADGTIEVAPTAYETVSERVLVKEAYEKLQPVPATYDTVTERVLVAPARTEWKPTQSRIYGNAVRNGSGELVTRANTQTGEIMCLVEIPAEYRTVTKRVLKTPASFQKVTVPAEYKNITRRIPKKVMTKTVATEPVYDTYTKTVVKTPAQEKRTVIPAEYETVTSRVKTMDGEVKWMPVLCDVNVTSAKVMEIQRALRAAGYNPGTIDGQLGSTTMTAITAYQRANGLASGELTLETVNKLGVTL